MVKTKFMKPDYKNLHPNSTDKKLKSIVSNIEKKYGVKLKQKTDDELTKYLKKQGFPSLAKLLKMTIN